MHVFNRELVTRLYREILFREPDPSGLDHYTSRLEGRKLGRPPLPVNRVAILQERTQGRTLSQIARNHSISRAMVCKVLKQEGHKGVPQPALQSVATTGPHKPN